MKNYTLAQDLQDLIDVHNITSFFAVLTTGDGITEIIQVNTAADFVINTIDKTVVEALTHLDPVPNLDVFYFKKN